MPKKPPISQNDLDSFYKAVEGTKPLVQKERVARTPPRRIKPKKEHYDDSLFSTHVHDDLSDVQSEEFISYKRPEIANKILRKLRKGQYNVEAILDLHGMSAEEAMSSVDNFLQQSLREGMRAVLIIHGKGHHSQKPILKNKLNRWLRDISVVLAFCSAAASHGSRGAIYVLLKRNSEENFLD